MTSSMNLIQLNDTNLNVIFDMDGVIFDTERLYIECIKPAAEKYGLVGVEDVARECIGLTDVETKRLMRERFGYDAPLEAIEQEAFEIFQKRYQEEGLTVKEGVVELLEYLKEEGARIAIGSSTEHDIVEMELRDAGLLQYFDALACGDMVEHSKPEPDVFLLAAEMLLGRENLQEKIADCIIIEDSFNGVIAARRAGGTVFMVPDLLEPTDEIQAMTDKVFGSLVEVKQWFEKETNMIKNVIFDIGRVLIGFEWMDYIHRLFDEETADKVTKALWHTHYWWELDRAVLSEEEILEMFYSAGPDVKEEIKEAFDRIGECMSRCEYAIPWIEEMKERGYKVYYLSNYSEHLMQANPEVLDFLPHMDGGVFSCYVQLIKPDPEIYRTLMDQYDLQAAECLFIDDRIDNVVAARKLGMQAIRFENYAQAREELEITLSQVPKV